MHDVFIGLVKERRLGKLKAPDAELFSGAFWSAAKAAELGLIDGITDLRSKMLEIFGEQGQTEGHTSRQTRPVGTSPAVFGVDRI